MFLAAHNNTAQAYNNNDFFFSLSFGHSLTTLTKFCPPCNDHQPTPGWQLYRNTFTITKKNLHTFDTSSNTPTYYLALST